MSMMPAPLPSRCAAMPMMAPIGDDAGAADAGDDDAVGMVGERQAGRGQRRPVLRLGHALAALELGAVHGDEGRAEAVEAGIVLVAARLVDGALAAPFGHQRLHRDAVRLDAAVAAALADQVVDDDALERIGEGAALAAAALLGGAGLVVDQDGDARHLAQLALHERRARRGDARSSPRGQSVSFGYFHGSSVTTTTRLAPSAATWRAICGTLSPPSLAWPPVMATASLNRIL